MLAGNSYLTPLLHNSSLNYHHLINLSTEKALVDRGKKGTCVSKVDGAEHTALLSGILLEM